MPDNNVRDDDEHQAEQTDTKQNEQKHPPGWPNPVEMREKNGYTKGKVYPLTGRKLFEMCRDAGKGGHPVYFEDFSFCLGDLQVINLTGLHRPDTNFLFRNCTFHGPVNWESSHLKSLRLIDCQFLKGDPDARLEAFVMNDDAYQKSFSEAGSTGPLGMRPCLDLRGVHLSILEIKIQAALTSLTWVRLNDAHITGSTQIRRLAPTNGSDNNKDAGLPLMISLDRATFGKSVDISCQADPVNETQVGLLISANGTEISGDLRLLGADSLKGDAQQPVRLALAAEDAKIAGELQLRDLKLFSLPLDGTQPNNEAPTEMAGLALDLRRARIGSLRIGEPLLSIVTEPKAHTKKPTKLTTYVCKMLNNASSIGSSPDSENGPSIVDLKVDRIGTFDSAAKPHMTEAKFWECFIEQLSPANPQSQTAEQDAENAIQRARAFRLFANAAAISGKRRVRDALGALESKATLDGQNPGNFNIYLFFVIPFSILFIIDFYLFLNIEDSIYKILFYYILFSFLFLLYKFNFNKHFDILKFVFKRISYFTIRDGREPFRILTFIAFLFLILSSSSYCAMQKGYFAPDEPEVYRSEAFLLLLAETSQANKSTGQRARLSTMQVKRAREVFWSTIWAVHDEKTSQSNGQAIEESTANLKEMRENIEAIPLLAFHNACRTNWALPDLISDDEWVDAIMNRYAKDEEHVHSDKLKLSTALQALSRRVVCERFLPAEYSAFSPFIYAADLVIPLLDLRIEDEWSLRVTEPNSGETIKWAKFLRFVEVLAVILGWIAAIVLAGAVTTLAEGRRLR